MCIMLFKMWKCEFKLTHQTGLESFWVCILGFFVSVKSNTTTLKHLILTQEMGEKENKMKQSRGEIKIKNNKHKKIKIGEEKTEESI